MVSINNKSLAQSIQMKRRNSSISQSVCKVKSDPWGDYQSIGKIPISFGKLVEILSIKFYPKNFSISHLTDEYLNISIGDEYVYGQIINELKRNNKFELKLFIYLYNTTDESKLKNKISNVHMCKTLKSLFTADVSVIKEEENDEINTSSSSNKSWKSLSISHQDRGNTLNLYRLII
jgi:hypothetical protein